uniref:Odorant receptor n=1 Tax=Ceracris kiangsu TaxID=227354 RepID=A0A6M6DP61_CERKI|nr:odorant receptor 16 [Ceracris kiangsu]
MALHSSLSLCVRLLRLAGLAPPDRCRSWRSPAGLLYRTYTTIAVGLVGHVLMPQAAGLVHYWGDMKVATENLCLLFGYATACYKLLAILLRRPRILSFVREVDARVTAMASASAEARAVMRRRDRWSRRLAVFMVVQSTSTAFIWSMNSLRMSLLMGSSQRTLPMISWYPYDMTVWYNYTVTFVIQFLSLITVAFCNRTMDILIITLMCQISSLLEMLNLKFRDISEDNWLQADKSRTEANPNYIWQSAASVFSTTTGPNAVLEYVRTRISENVSQSEIYTKLTRCIEVHQEIIRCAKELEMLMNDIFLIDFVCCMIVVCSTLYVSTSESEKLGDLMSHFGYLVAMTYPVLLYCLSAHDIIDQSERVSLSAYCSPWPQAAARYRRALCIVTCRGQRPLTLTAGKFYVISRATFLTLMNASYSYYQILREINVKRSD